MSHWVDELRARQDVVTIPRVWVTGRALDALLHNSNNRPADVLAVAVPFLHLFGTVCGSWQMARAARAAFQCLVRSGNHADHAADIVATARFWFGHLAPFAEAHARVVIHGGTTVGEPAAFQAKDSASSLFEKATNI